MLLNPFPYLLRHCLMPLKKSTFENIVAKEEITRNEQFSPPAAVFSTPFGNYTFIFICFPFLCQDIFKVVCCRIVVCGIGSQLFICHDIPLEGVVCLENVWEKEAKRLEYWTKSFNPILQTDAF